MNEYYKLFECDSKEFYQLTRQSDKLEFVKRRYKQLLLKYHPDKNTLLSARKSGHYIIIINKAYQKTIDYIKTNNETCALGIVLDTLKDYTKTDDKDTDKFIKHHGFQLLRYFKFS